MVEFAGDAPGRRRGSPGAVRYVGAHVVRAAVARKEALEDRGRPADPVTAFVAGLAPAGLVPVKHKGS